MKLLKSTSGADRLRGLIEDTRVAMMNYQVRPWNSDTYCPQLPPQTSSQQDIYNKSCRLMVSLASLVSDPAQ